MGRKQPRQPARREDRGTSLPQWNAVVHFPRNRKSRPPPWNVERRCSGSLLPWAAVASWSAHSVESSSGTVPSTTPSTKSTSFFRAHPVETLRAVQAEFAEKGIPVAHVIPGLRVPSAFFSKPRKGFLAYVQSIEPDVHSIPCSFNRILIAAYFKPKMAMGSVVSSLEGAPYPKGNAKPWCTGASIVCCATAWTASSASAASRGIKPLAASTECWPTAAN